MESNIQKIEEIVAKVFGENLGAHNSRFGGIKGRQMFVYLLSLYTELSYREIAERVGFKQKSSVHPILVLVKKRCSASSYVRERVMLMEGMVEMAMLVPKEMVKQLKVYPAVEGTPCAHFGCKKRLNANDLLYSNKCIDHQQGNTSLMSLAEYYVNKKVVKQKRRRA